MHLYEHQQKILTNDPLWALIALGTGGGKTRVCLELADGATLVICPKQQKLDRTWERNAEKFGIICNLTVVSKEEFKRDWRKYKRYDTVIIDECHTVLGVTPDTRRRKGIEIPKSSQLFEAVRDFINETRPNRLYLASATPVTKPLNLWAIAEIFGKGWDYFKFREKYYIERKMGGRKIWITKQSEEIRNRLAEVTKSFGYTGKLQDWFDVPEQTHLSPDQGDIEWIELTEEQKDAIEIIEETEADPLVIRCKKRTIENGVLYDYGSEYVSEREERMVKKTVIFPSEKIEHIERYAEEFGKVLVFAAYTAQVQSIEKALRGKGHATFVLTGETKDRGTVIAEAERAERGIVIAQASISAGYELPSYPCVIFASKSYRYVDYEQALGRVLRANAIKKNLYVHLVVKGGPDEDCHRAILSGQDFQEKLMS